MKAIEINLIPPEEVPESPYTIRNIATLVTSFLIAIGLILLALQMNSLKSGYVQRKNQLVQRLEVYKIQKAKIDKLQQKKADLEQRYKLITEVLGQRVTWNDKLSDMHRQTPEDVWLSQIAMEIQQDEQFQSAGKIGISVSQKKSQPQDLKEDAQPLILISISGYTLGLSKISGLIDNLSSSPFFEKTVLQKISKTTVKNRAVISFEINTQLSGLLGKL